jgi:hypothetical protein
MGVRIALVVLTVFAALWAFAALRSSGAAPGLALVPAAVSLALLAAGWQGSNLFPAGGARVGRVVGLWSFIELAALLVAANVLEHMHRPDLMFPFGAIIVGLHFFPLALGIPVRLYLATGAGLVLAGLVGFAVPVAERPLIVGIGAAVTLWATAVVIVSRSRKLAESRQAS